MKAPVTGLFRAELKPCFPGSGRERELFPTPETVPSSVSVQVKHGQDFSQSPWHSSRSLSAVPII